MKRLLLVGGAVILGACAMHPDTLRDDRRTRTGAGGDVAPKAPAETGSVPAADNSAFALTINPILTTSCGGGKCHGAGSPYGAYVDSPAAVAAAAAKINTRVANSTMPVPGTGKTISPDSKAKLLAYAKGLIPAASAAPPQPAPQPAPSPTAGSTTTTPTKPDNCPTDVAAPATPITFEEIAPVLVASCGGAGVCHGPGSAGRDQFTGDAKSFREDGHSTLAHFAPNAPNKMPQGRDIAAADKTRLIQFLCF